LLTGAATPEPVVWYNQQSFSGWRMATIPVEDLFYNFDLLLGFVVLFNAQMKKKSAAFR
jgi:lycopene cyclase domain-containing protein